MRLVIAGSRDLPDAKRKLWTFFKSPQGVYLASQVQAVATGHSGNVDLAGEAWARYAGKPLFLFPYPSNQEMADKGTDLSKLKNPRRVAGPIRNRWQAKWAAQVPASALLVLWWHDSSGSADMINAASENGLIIIERRF